MRISDWSSDVCSSDLVAISATGFAPVTSALFLADDPYSYSDAVFAVKESLKVVCSASALLPPLGCHDSPVWELCHRIVLARLATRWWRPLFAMPFARRLADTMARLRTFAPMILPRSPCVR